MAITREKITGKPNRNGRKKQVERVDKLITPGRWDTIALIGAAPSSKHRVPHIPKEHGHFAIAAIWGMEEVQRWDVAIEIHQRWMLEHKNYSEGLLDWLKQEHDFPIFMQDKSPDFPASEKYPLDLINERFLGGMYREDDPLHYYVSSFDFLMGLALLYEPKRIEVYGYDMATDTEYRYQREGASFWMGVAAGQGVDVWIPEESPMLSGMIYGYEGTRVVRYERIQDLQPTLRAAMEKAEEEYTEIKAGLPDLSNGQEPDEETQKTLGMMGNLQDFYHLYSGALQAAEQVLADFSLGDIIPRQFLDKNHIKLRWELSHNLSRLNWYEGIVRDRIMRYQVHKGQEPNRSIFRGELDDAYQGQARVRNDYFTNSGGVQLLAHLIGECDLKKTQDFNLELNVIEQDVEKET